MPKSTISKKKLSESRSVEEAQVGWVVPYSHDISRGPFEAFTSWWKSLLDIISGHTRIYGKSEKWLQERGLGAGLYTVLMSLEEKKERSSISLTIGRLESDVEEPISEEQGGKEQKWPSYAIEEFEKIDENSEGLENAGEDKSQILYYIMEIEVLLERVTRKARAINREAEARLAASLRDICRIHEPSELSNEQIKCFTGSLRALIEGWGQLNREKVKWIRSRLLKAGLTWLPVTKRAEKDIAEAKKAAGIDEQ
jgi:hypothetical protein